MFVYAKVRFVLEFPQDVYVESTGRSWTADRIVIG